MAFSLLVNIMSTCFFCASVEVGGDKGGLREEPGRWGGGEINAAPRDFSGALFPLEAAAAAQATR